MSYLIGFDLGTHQTKICVRNATNPTETTYKFFEFSLPNGETTVLFPSIVQVNKDHTLSYGYTDGNHLILEGIKAPKPELEGIKEIPDFERPPFVKPSKYPRKPVFDPWLDNLRKLKGEKTELDKWKEECRLIDSKAKKAWKRECKEAHSKYIALVESLQKQNDIVREEYQRKLYAWEEASRNTDLVFRYFKLHAFTSQGEWNCRTIMSRDVCVWYVGYILLLLQERYGKDLAFQFGVPCGASDDKRDRIVTQNAYQIYIAAYDLIQNFTDIQDYLAATYEDLKSLTQYKRIDDEIKNQYSFDDLPEAFAGLVAVTLQEKLAVGFHLLVDIGGGTTDMALFSVPSSKKPDIIYVTSFGYGINSILKEAAKQLDKDIDILQYDFLSNRNKEHFSEPIDSFKADLVTEGQKIIERLTKSYADSYYHHGRYLSELAKVLCDQSVLYGGGGGTYHELHTPIDVFTDVRKVDKVMLSINNLINEGIDDNLFTILSTSYGLASFEKPFGGIKCTDISIAFQKFLPEVSRANSRPDRFDHDD